MSLYMDEQRDDSLSPWSMEGVKAALPHTTPAAMLISIFAVSLYIFYKMFKIIFPNFQWNPFAPLYSSSNNTNLSAVGQASYSGSYNAQRKYHGVGTLRNRDGSSYSGQFVDGLMHGQGTYNFVSGTSYQGEFEAGKFHGQGVESYPEGSVYTGQFAHGSRHGKGVMKYSISSESSGDKSAVELYDGNWKEGKKHGKGRVKDFGSKTWRDVRYDMGKQLLSSKKQDASLVANPDAST